MVSDSFQGGCVCENAAGLRLGTDNVEFAALAAPRPMILVGASGDWTAKTMTNAFPAIRGVYSLIGSTGRIEAAVFDFPHNYNQTSRNAVYAFMGRWLLGIEDTDAAPARARSSPRSPRTSGPSTPATRPRRTARPPRELEADLIKRLGSQIEALAPRPGEPERWEAARRFLTVSLRTGRPGESPAREHRRSREFAACRARGSRSSTRSSAGGRGARRFPWSG